MNSSHIPALLKPVLAIGGLLLAVAWIAGVFNDKVAPGLLSREQSPDAATVVVNLQILPVFESVAGSLRAKQATLVSSQILARITRITVRAGDTVRAGELLIGLDDADAKSRLAQAQDRVRATEARLKESKLEHTRAVTLSRQGLIATADLDRARSNHEALIADLSALEHMVDEASVLLQYTRIEAPIDGKIVDRFAEPGDTATPGVTLLSLYNPLTLRVEARVREQLAIHLRLGQELRVKVLALDRSVPAIIDELVPAADTGSRSFLIKARLSYDEVLRPGMYAEVEIPGSDIERLVIPRTAVAEVGQLDVVWVHSAEMPQRRFVKLGRNLPGDGVEVLAGLSEGEVILMTPPSASAGD